MDFSALYSVVIYFIIGRSTMMIGGLDVLLVKSLMLCLFQGLTRMFSFHYILLSNCCCRDDKLKRIICETSKFDQVSSSLS